MTRSLLGVVLPYLANLAADAPWVPFEGPIELLASFDEPWLVWGRPVIGLILGLGFAGWVVVSSPVLHLSNDDIRVECRGQIERVIQRETVAAIHRRGSKVIIETANGRELFNDEIEGDKVAIRDAFVRHAYPWEGDTA